MYGRKITVRIVTKSGRNAQHSYYLNGSDEATKFMNLLDQRGLAYTLDDTIFLDDCKFATELLDAFEYTCAQQ